MNLKKPVIICIVFNFARNCFNIFYLIENIKVDIDRSQDSVKIEVLNASKDLYISTSQESDALYAKINCPADEDIKVKNKAILVNHLKEYGTEIGKKKILYLYVRF